MGAHVEKLTLTGNASINGTDNEQRNRIVGNDAANMLDGGTGEDTLKGGLGDDTYHTDGGDSITESTNQGVDRVISTVSYKLGANLENLTLTGVRRSTAAATSLPT